MKKYILLIILIATFNSAFSQWPKTITGTVISSLDKTSIPGVNVAVKGTTVATATDAEGRYSIVVSSDKDILIFSFVGYNSQEITVGNKSTIDVHLTESVHQLSEVVVTGYGITAQKSLTGSVAGVTRSGRNRIKARSHNTEEYDFVNENIFHHAQRNPLSTFSIDVDAASYSNIRRFINQGSKPPIDAVRIEEMINYFNYDYPQPKAEHPFSIVTEMSEAPWNKEHRLVKIGLKGKSISLNELPPSNLVFLIDVSGSMQDENKLPLVKSSLRLLVEQLRPVDKISMVVYAGAAGVVLLPTNGSQKREILEALDNLEAGGSTAGGAGLSLAYQLAKMNYDAKANNRVILATDGDFNVGASSDGEMVRLIESKRDDGIFLTVLGFGMGNYKDSKMEKLADKGNGNYAYIDGLKEAKKVLATELGATLFTIAKDVKLQVEFNPEKVAAYRLIGYENRVLEHEDFNNDKKDAGDLGAGHSVTALYEIIPAGSTSRFYKVDDLKYQKLKPNKTESISDEVMTIKLRYKKPSQARSELLQVVVNDRSLSLVDASIDFRWAASVAAFGMRLRNSEYVQNFSYDEIIQLAESARGEDKFGYRDEFILMVKSYASLAKE